VHLQTRNARSYTQANTRGRAQVDDLLTPEKLSLRLREGVAPSKKGVRPVYAENLTWKRCKSADELMRVYLEVLRSCA
jgi:hypothetical protein